ncbi:SDR family oxidoreductase [Dyadobacter fermentans]|uniref:NmrA family protein n=1 Tax=Dyadobacter fermentans (strain ATCC 700827 / DSM 18053 / CIP 107007 / KCTC 52180 / NS114) TaxID=471854 RepID=C6W6Y9_DYAFD|nr:NAD(P)H-binding protein [Dyadobacter fermentans]ACT92598.1 NmrA family protein [Dyadobacter fermentans DSM 18053]
MKYIITGSLGNISLPVTQNLLKAGHEVVVISSNTDKKEQIENLGAQAAIGSVQDPVFLEAAFRGGDVAYLMIPSVFSLSDYAAFQIDVADKYVQAIQSAGITRIVLLSSIGAHMRKGAGPIDALGYLEEKLAEVQGLQVKILRPSYFFNNLYSQIGLIKNAGIAGSNFGGTDEKLVLVDTDDIAKVATEQLLAPFPEAQTITYISSDERHPTEIAAVLGAAVGKEGTPWVTFSDEDSYNGMLQAGLNESFAGLYRDMGQALQNGTMQEDYWKNSSEIKGSFKLEDFAKRFAGAYQA